MKKNACPGCGAVFHGKRCRSCGYEPFGDVTAVKTSPRKTTPKKEPKRFVLIRFLILLYLIYSLMPFFREWGLKLEAIEESNRTPASSQHSREVPHG